MRFSTHNTDRPFSEMNVMWHWMTKTFGPPSAHDTNSRWSYGKEPDFVGSTMVNGPSDIEWIEFVNEGDYTWAILRWE